MNWTRLIDAAKRRVLGRSGSQPFRSSADYWRQRYARGGNSGAGSYNHLAEFKAEVINDFVASNGIADVIELGCGDGHQLELARYPRYTGYDVSPEAVELCRKRFKDDPGKTFFPLTQYDGRQADLALSLDVIFHLVEDEVFDDYMQRLFSAARRHVIVYSSNDQNIDDPAPHVRHRKFSDWIARERPEWELLTRVPNRYPYNGDYRVTSFADFYIYGRKTA